MAYNNGFPMTYQPMYQPYVQPTPPPQQNNTGIQWIQGEQAAKSYLTAPNTTIALWDSECQKIYLKSTDASGMPSMKTLEYTILDGQQSKPTVEYATKEEMDKLKERLDHLYNELEGGK